MGKSWSHYRILEPMQIWKTLKKYFCLIHLFSFNLYTLPVKRVVRVSGLTNSLLLFNTRTLNALILYYGVKSGSNISRSKDAYQNEALKSTLWSKLQCWKQRAARFAHKLNITNKSSFASSNECLRNYYVNTRNSVDLPVNRAHRTASSYLVSDILVYLLYTLLSYVAYSAFQPSRHKLKS